MAQIVFESGIREIRGNMGSFTFRKHADGSITITRTRIANPDRIPTGAQLDHQLVFKQAVARARNFMQQPETVAAYQEVVTRRGPMAQLRATMIGDILKPPQVQRVDLSDYHGQVGQGILVLADDNVGVARLTLKVTDTTGDQVWESAEKVFSGPDLAPTVIWEYTATKAVPDGLAAQVTVRAYDLAGNFGELTDFVVA